MLCIVAIGCPDLPAVVNAWSARVGNTLTVRCNFSRDMYQLRCDDSGRWIGDRINCSAGASVESFPPTRARTTKKLLFRRRSVNVTLSSLIAEFTSARSRRRFRQFRSHVSYLRHLPSIGVNQTASGPTWPTMTGLHICLSRNVWSDRHLPNLLAVPSVIAQPLQSVYQLISIVYWKIPTQWLKQKRNYSPAKATEYVFTAVGLCVCLSVCLLTVCDHDN